jgi:hypothetical protein
MAAFNVRTPVMIICACALIGLAGCERSKHDDMSWAQGALERNADLQVLSVDRQARSFTVRLKSTGELRIVQANEVVGSVPSAPATASTAANAAAPEQAASPTPAPESAAASAPESAAAPEPQPKSARSAASGNARASGFAPTDSVARGLAVERRDEPIVCQGARFLRIDGRNIEFEGDAISAEDGCEIHITNSRIAAKGVGVSARAANVHIENSSIEGQSGSILASDGAQVYAEASRFRGLSRGLTSETLHDLGGNVWN